MLDVVHPVVEQGPVARLFVRLADQSDQPTPFVLRLLAGAIPGDHEGGGMHRGVVLRQRGMRYPDLGRTALREALKEAAHGVGRDQQRDVAPAGTAGVRDNICGIGNIAPGGPHALGGIAKGNAGNLPDEGREGSDGIVEEIGRNQIMDLHPVCMSEEVLERVKNLTEPLQRE